MRMRSPCLLNFITTSVFFSARRDPVMSKASDRTITAILFNSKQPFFVVYSLTPLSKCLEYLLFYTINTQERIPFLITHKKRRDIFLALAEYKNLFWWRRRELNPRPKALRSGFYMFILPIESRIPGCRKAGVPKSHPPLSYSGGRGKSPEPAC